MPQPHHENTLNVWTADILREDYGLDAHQEQNQASGGRIDIEVRIGPVKIALEAEQGQNAAKTLEAIGDADSRLKRKDADCAIAICYPDGISGKAQLLDSRMLWTIRAPNNLVPASDANWSDAGMGELASIVKLAPMQVGDPDLGRQSSVRASGRRGGQAWRVPED